MKRHDNLWLHHDSSSLKYVTNEIYLVWLGMLTFSCNVKNVKRAEECREQPVYFSKISRVLLLFSLMTSYLWHFAGVLIFFVLLGFFGLILHCSSFNSNDPCMSGCRNCCYGWGILDCFPISMEACFALVVIFVIVFAILGIAYGFLAATMAVQRIWQRHYHILTKRELTKVVNSYLMQLNSYLFIWLQYS